MGVVTGIVLYAIIWFMTFLVALQVRVTTQDDIGKGRVAGTHGSAPAETHLRARVIWTSGVAAVLWSVIAAIIVFDLITLEDIDLFTRFGLGSSAR